MFHHFATIVPQPGGQRSVCTVGSQTLLADIAHEHLNSPHAYLLVEDPAGSPIGVVGVDDIRRRINSPNFMERRRWLNTPVEAALNGRICAGISESRRSGQPAPEQSMPCTLVSQDERLVAIVHDDDVLISWRAIEQVVQKAQNDHVTGLPLRSVFDSHLRAECTRANRSGDSVAVVLIDVDLFKEINDRLGHAAGDAVLSAVGRTLRSTFRSYDMVARYGGDEFAVLCCGCLPGEIEATVARIRHAMNRLQADISIPRPLPTLSIGACVAHDPGQITTPQQIVEAADECLYAAKRDGRNRSVCTEIGMESPVP